MCPGTVGPPIQDLDAALATARVLTVSKGKQIKTVAPAATKRNTKKQKNPNELASAAIKPKAKKQKNPDELPSNNTPAVCANTATSIHDNAGSEGGFREREREGY